MGPRYRGLYGKYKVRRVDDPTGKHDNCQYFVLDPTHDAISRHALREYAVVAREAGFLALAKDIDEWVNGMAEELHSVEEDFQGTSNPPPSEQRQPPES